MELSCVLRQDDMHAHAQHTSSHPTCGVYYVQAAYIMRAPVHHITPVLVTMVLNRH
jgi:hypothetical protein